MISLERVTKRYGQHVALRDVSFTVEKGQIAGLLGRNGAGKTTALNLMTGYFPPDEGRVLVDGMDMLTEGQACKRRIGYLPEKPPLYDEMTVKDYLRFVSELREVVPKGIPDHVAEILKVCDLEKQGERVIGNLSKGTRQRVGIAQALCGNPEVLILDEPTAGLDPLQVVETRKLIRLLGEEHTILFSSHILSEVQQLCDVAFILHEGRLIRRVPLRETEGTDLVRIRLSAAGTARELQPAIRSIGCVQHVETLPTEEEGVAEMRITGTKADARGRMTDQLFSLCAALGTPIRRMETEKDDLETAFLQAITE
ncbi:MAG: ABC transporter ATP-binding protein [Clostridia bacterium]|nr:ABC transporter ATP-binding protein [Clostridia bacterium]